MSGDMNERLKRAGEGFENYYGYQPESFFSAPGRTELGGNHTDHQRGHVLAAAVNLDILAAVSPTGTEVIRFLSEGYPVIEVNLADLNPRKAEEGTSAALIRGIAARMEELGCPLGNAGFDAYAISDVPSGSGLSSSAAFEILIGTILNVLFCDSGFTPVDIACIGQYAENVYFDKPCGLMDQAASSVGGVVAIDLGDPDDIKVEKIDLNLEDEGYALCIVDSHASHADLTEEYASVTNEMRAASALFGKERLREVPEEEFLAALPKLREMVGDRAVLRAMHYYADDRRAMLEAEALKGNDFDEFLRLVRESGLSSALYLQNIVPAGQVEDQSLMFTLALAEKILGDRGAVRVHGGGFGGTAQAFVPLDMLDEFKEGMEAVLGKGSCHVLSIRPDGGVCVAGKVER